MAPLHNSGQADHISLFIPNRDSEATEEPEKPAAKTKKEL
jgi:hypothetical protein